MLDLEPIKKRLARATPGPWAWRQDLFRHKYMQELKNGTWRARPGKSANDSWVMLLTGPQRRLKYVDETIDNVLNRRFDEFDFEWVIALRWSQVKGNVLMGCGPSPEDADLIANAPTDIAALIAEVERLRAELGK
jgi:hypothetical protein